MKRPKTNDGARNINHSDPSLPEVILMLELFVFFVCDSEIRFVLRVSESKLTKHEVKFRFFGDECARSRGRGEGGRSQEEKEESVQKGWEALHFRQAVS